MKRICDILMVLLVAVAVTSCGSRADRPGLVAIDSLILHDPDSACEVLAAYPADSLTNDDDRAYHALLTTIAHYKAYRPATTDSIINIAVSHYDRNGSNTDHRMRSLLYKGCVMEELGNPEQAIEYYKRAETACPTDDYFNIGYINLRKAGLYQSNYVDSIPFDNLRRAKHAFHLAGDKSFEAKSLNSMGALYSLSNIDSARIYINQSIAIAKEANDSITLYDAYYSLCTILYEQEDYKAITELVSKNLIPRPNEYSRAIFDIISISFSKQGNTKEAMHFMTGAPLANCIEDTISQLRALAEYDMACGDYQMHILHNNIAVEKTDSLLLAGQADKLREAEAKFNLAEQEVNHLSKQKSLILSVAVLLFLFFVVSVIVYIQRKQIIRSAEEKEEAQNQLVSLRNQMHQMALDSQKRVSELKAQEEQLRNMQAVINNYNFNNDERVNTEKFEQQLKQTTETLRATEISVAIHNKTRFCLDEIIRVSFYSGKYNSDQVIDNDSSLDLSPEFWDTAYEIITLKHNCFFARLKETHQLSDNEKKLLALCAINIPSAVIRRILNYKSIQVVTNFKRKLAIKITGTSTRIDDIFTKNS